MTIAFISTNLIFLNLIQMNTSHTTQAKYALGWLSTLKYMSESYTFKLYMMGVIEGLG